MKSENAKNIWLPGALVTAVASLFMVASAGAQAPASQERAATGAELPAASEPATVVEEKKIDQFADAYIAVQKIQSQATQQLSATTDEVKAQQVKETAETQMVEAVQRTGLQIEEFNQIVQAMASDASLRDRVSGKIDERQRTS